LALKVVFGKLLLYPSCVKKILAQCAAMMTGTVCFEQKTVISNAKFGDLGDNGDRGTALSTMYFDTWSKVRYLESPNLICLFTMQLLWGYNDD